MAAQKRESIEERVTRKREEFAVKKEEFATLKNEAVIPEKNVRSLSIDVDISATITGLKAIQREAKEATKALRELEEVEGRVINVMTADKRELIASVGGDDAIVHNDYVVEVSGVDASSLNLITMGRNDVAFNNAGAKKALASYYEEEGSRFYAQWEQDGADNVRNEQRVSMTAIPTAILQRELETREVVTVYHLDAHGSYAKLSIDNGREGGCQVIEGPAVITVNYD